jgi:hypothetical protein
MLFDTEIALVESYEIIIVCIGCLVNTQFCLTRFVKMFRYEYNYLFAEIDRVFP